MRDDRQADPHLRLQPARPHGGLTRDDGWVASGVGEYLDADPGPLPTEEDSGESRAADTLIRTAPDNAEAVRVFADYRAESAYWWDHYRDSRRRRIAVLVTALSDRVGLSPTPTRLLAMVTGSRRRHFFFAGTFLAGAFGAGANRRSVSQPPG